MRFVAFKKDGKAKLGVRTDAGLVDLSKVDKTLPTDLKELLAKGKGAMAKAGRAAAKAPAKAIVKGRVNYLTPIQEPNKIICIGLNYKDHAAEAGLKIPTYPVVFNRFTTVLRTAGSAYYPAETVEAFRLRSRARCRYRQEGPQHQKKRSAQLRGRLCGRQ
jgi:2-keto-4-pentenoate hydratase/2-oxohepta-3-ene-1,7-dioic acid hydratase in catechol pathway